jgi:hypothetical protein
LNQKRNGFFVEIGGYDGESFSNSLFLEKERGWSGLLVEANPYTYELMSNILQQRFLWRVAMFHLLHTIWRLRQYAVDVFSLL